MATEISQISHLRTKDLHRLYAPQVFVWEEASLTLLHVPQREAPTPCYQTPAWCDNKSVQLMAERTSIPRTGISLIMTAQAKNSHNAYCCIRSSLNPKNTLTRNSQNTELHNFYKNSNSK